MTDRLGTVLRDLASSAVVDRLPSPEELRTSGAHRRGRTRVQVVAAAAVVVAAFAAVSLSQDSSAPGPQPTVPSPSPTVSGVQRYPVAADGHRFSAHAVAASGGRYVVVGDSSDRVEEPGPPVYWSDDGVSWQAAAGAPDSVNVTDVIAVAGAFLAVGVDQDGPAAWRSADGDTWLDASVTVDGRGEFDALWGLTRTRLGLYAWGFDGGRARLWRSEDGTAWAPVANRSVFDLPLTEGICAVRDFAGGLRATGVEAARGSRQGHRVVWTSSDGERWVLAEARGRPQIWCDPPTALGHGEAQGDAGLVRIADPYGAADTMELVPAED